MKIRKILPSSIATLILFANLAVFHQVLAQGPLAPPGAPSPTMKTLDEIEPRINLATVAGDATAMHVITQPGSYYLSENLDVTTTNGIEIEADGVTLDLMGFNIFRSSMAAAVGTAISLNVGGLSNIWIKNGHITGGVSYNSSSIGDQFMGPGFANGISRVSSPQPTNVRVSHVHVSGCDAGGIILQGSVTTVSNTVEHSSVKVAGDIGIRASQVHHSTAITCGSIAIFASGNVNFCHGESTGSDGIDARGNVSNSYGLTTDNGSTSEGIIAADNVSNSVGTSSGGTGILSSGNVSDSYGVSTGTSSLADGISAEGNVSNSRGTSSESDGINADGNVSNSYGIGGATGDGIFASGNVTNSHGESVGDDGIETSRTISYSHGESTGTGVGLECAIAIGCTSSGGEAIGNKYNMP